MTDRLLLTVNYSFTEKNMMILFRRILFCLLWLWLPVSPGGGKRLAAFAR